MPGTKDDAYFIIFEMTDQAYFPYLSFLFIRDLRSTFSDLIFIFLLAEYSPVSRFNAYITFVPLVLLIR